MFAGSAARNFAKEKNCEPKTRSERRQTQTVRRMLKTNRPRIALMNQAHTVSGSRGSVIPFARRSMVVTAKFSALPAHAAQNAATLALHSVIPACGAIKKD